MVVSPAPLDAVWHDLECDSYRVDLPLWRELAVAARGARRSARVLDIGAGTGRVAIELARAGERVTALDSDAGLLAALRERATALQVRAELGDARAFHLRGPAYDLALMPMQTLQLLGGPQERIAAFACAAAHLRPGALLACAIVTDVEAFDARGGRAGPVPEQIRIAGTHYESRAVLVQVDSRAIRIEREHSIDGQLEPGRDVVELAQVEETQLWEEARAAGLQPEPSHEIAATFEHTASTVVVLRA
jgi:SAM-dependent methyltransferase